MLGDPLHQVRAITKDQFIEFARGEETELLGKAHGFLELLLGELAADAGEAWKLKHKALRFFR